MATDFIGTKTMNMDIVKAELKPWTDKDGNTRYYLNNIASLIGAYRRDTGRELNSYYDHEECRASGGRVRQCIEANIIPKTKAYIDEDGKVHVYGYASAGVGSQMMMPELIENAVNRTYGYCTEEERQQRMDCVGKTAYDVKVGDTVEIVDGRKEVGKTFIVAKVSAYFFSQYREPNTYLYDKDGFKVQAQHCKITDVGYSY